jgi:hypothetical protein
MKRASYGNLISSFILLACLTQPACGGDDGEDPKPMDAGQDAGRDGGMDAGDAGGVIDAAVKLSDGEILGILSAFNGVQVTVPAGVLNRTMNAAVRTYMQAVVAERNAALNRQSAIVTALMVSPMSTTYSMQYTTEGSVQAATLNSQSAATFDPAFLDWQIQMQDRLLKQMKDIMMPSATADAVKAELTVLQNEITARVAQARSLRNPSDAGMSPLDAGKPDGG